MTEAPSVQTFLGAAGSCPEISWGGKVWRIGHPTQRAKAALEEIVAAQAIQEVVKLKPVLPAEVYDEMFVSTRRAIGGQGFRTLGEDWNAAISKPGNAHLFFWALLRECHSEATEADALGLMSDCGDEVAAALERVIPFFFEVILDSPKIPASKRQALKKSLVHQFTASLQSLRQPTPSS